MSGKKSKELRRMFPDKDTYNTVKRYYSKIPSENKQEFWDTMKQVSKNMADGTYNEKNL